MKYTINNKTRINKYTVALATSTAMMTSASAATIAWGEFDLDATVSEISTKGTLIKAFNMVNSDRVGTDTTTINGVTFTAIDLGRPLRSINGSTEVSTGDASLDLLFRQFKHFTTGPITLTDLTIGVEYELQTFFGYNLGTQLAMNVGDGITIQKTSSGTVENGAWITGTFIADATTQGFHSSYDANTRSFISGYQLRSVPEPSSAVLIGLGGLALILHRHR